MATDVKEQSPHPPGEAPDVSVVMPVYNTPPEYLREAVEGVLAQEFPSFELILVDDACDEPTKAILRRYAADPRVRVIPSSGRGTGATRQTGLASAAGRGVLFLDSDDVFHRRLLADLYDALTQTEADIAIVPFKKLGRLKVRDRFGSGRRVISAKEFAPVLFQMTVVMIWNKMFRRSFLTDNDLHFHPLEVSEDLYFTRRALSRAKSVVFVNGPPRLSYRIFRRGSVSHTARRTEGDFLKAVSFLQEEIEKDGTWPIFHRTFLTLCLSIAQGHARRLGFGRQESFRRRLKEEFFPRWGIDSQGRADYDKKCRPFVRFILGKKDPFRKEWLPAGGYDYYAFGIRVFRYRPHPLPQDPKKG